MASLLIIILGALEKLFSSYAKPFFRLSARLVSVGEIQIGITATRPDDRPLDDRVAKLEVAREALVESLAAIDQMQTDARVAKDEYATNRRNLQAILESKQDAEAKLADIRAAMKQDVAAFQELAGVPNLNRERWIAFFAGVLASTISAALVALATFVWSAFT